MIQNQSTAIPPSEFSTEPGKASLDWGLATPGNFSFIPYVSEDELRDIPRERSLHKITRESS